VRVKSARVGAVGQRVEPLRRDAELGLQEVVGAQRTGEDRGGQPAGDPFFQTAGDGEETAVWIQKVVVYHLFGQAALKIEDERHAQQFGQQAANQRPFVHVAVNQMRAETQALNQSLRHQVNIEGQFVPRGTDFIIGVIGQRRGAADVQPWHIAPFIIGDDGYLLTQFL
jgi:hypothetical protein